VFPRLQREIPTFTQEMMVSPRAEAEVEEVTSEGHKLEVTLPQQQIPCEERKAQEE
jgi:hypothetical protein